MQHNFSKGRFVFEEIDIETVWRARLKRAAPNVFRAEFLENRAPRENIPFLVFDSFLHDELNTTVWNYPPRDVWNIPRTRVSQTPYRVIKFYKSKESYQEHHDCRYVSSLYYLSRLMLRVPINPVISAFIPRGVPESRLPLSFPFFQMGNVTQLTVARPISIRKNFSD